MRSTEGEPLTGNGTQLDADRRQFLARCGRFAVVTPPAITLLLSTSLNSTAIAHSGGRDERHGYEERHGHEGRHGNNGYGNGGGDGSPNGKRDHDR
jgi:hypothetical protein